MPLLSLPCDALLSILACADLQSLRSVRAACKSLRQHARAAVRSAAFLEVEANAHAVRAATWRERPPTATPLKGHLSLRSVHAIAISGATIASIAQDNTMILWNAAEEKLIDSFRLAATPPLCVASRGALVAVGSFGCGTC